MHWIVLMMLWNKIWCNVITKTSPIVSFLHALPCEGVTTVFKDNIRSHALLENTDIHCLRTPISTQAGWTCTPWFSPPHRVFRIHRHPCLNLTLMIAVIVSEHTFVFMDPYIDPCSIQVLDRHRNPVIMRDWIPHFRSMSIVLLVSHSFHVQLFVSVEQPHSTPSTYHMCFMNNSLRSTFCSQIGNVSHNQVECLNHNCLYKFHIALNIRSNLGCQHVLLLTCIVGNLIEESHSVHTTGDFTYSMLATCQTTRSQGTRWVADTIYTGTHMHVCNDLVIRIQIAKCHLKISSWILCIFGNTPLLTNDARLPCTPWSRTWVPRRATLIPPNNQWLVWRGLRRNHESDIKANLRVSLPTDYIKWIRTW